jgi:hypothetical protein
LYDKYAIASNLLKVVEKNAKKALTNLTTSKEAFAEAFIDLDAEDTIAEALEAADVVINANSIPDAKTEKKGDKK